MTKAKEAVEIMKDDFNCFQAVLTVFAEELGLEQELILKMASGFAGGMGGMGGTCGAVTAAYVVISFKYGKTESDDMQAGVQTTGMIQSFAREFETLHGSTLCRELINYDISTLSGFKKAKGSGVFADKCVGFVEDAVNILEKLFY